jgi:hypothetical protein
MSISRFLLGLGFILFATGAMAQENSDQDAMAAAAGLKAAGL